MKDSKPGVFKLHKGKGRAPPVVEIDVHYFAILVENILQISGTNVSGKVSYVDFTVVVATMNSLSVSVHLGFFARAPSNG